MTKQKKHTHLVIFMLLCDYYVLLCFAWCLQWHDVYTHFLKNGWTASENRVEHNTPIAVDLITALFFPVRKESGLWKLRSPGVRHGVIAYVVMSV
jgi:hypothetical protein